MINTLLFDLDGTLFETAQGIHKAVNRFYLHHELPEMSLETVNRLIGFGANYFIDGLDLVTQNQILTLQKYEDEFLEIYSESYLSDSTLMPNALEFLKEWNGQLAIVSNKKERFVRGLIENSPLKAFKWAALIGGDSYSEKKPSSLPLNKAMEACHSLPKNTVLIGDGLADAHGSKAAGICFIGVSFGGSPKNVLIENGAYKVIDNFSELNLAIQSII